MRDFQIKLIKDRLARETCIYLHTEGYKNLRNDEYNMNHTQRRTGHASTGRNKLVSKRNSLERVL